MDIQTGSDPADPLDPGVSAHLGSPRAGLEDGPLSWFTLSLFLSGVYEGGQSDTCDGPFLEALFAKSSLTFELVPISPLTGSAVVETIGHLTLNSWSLCKRYFRD